MAGVSHHWLWRWPVARLLELAESSGPLPVETGRGSRQKSIVLGGGSTPHGAPDVLVRAAVRIVASDDKIDMWPSVGFDQRQRDDAIGLRWPAAAGSAPPVVAQ